MSNNVSNQQEPTKKCKHCQSDIPKKANICPVCKKRQKGIGCLTFIFALIIVFSIIIIGTNIQNSSIQKTVSGVNDESEYITLEEYNQIQTGMTYDEVAEIIGSSGTQSSKTESNGYSLVTYTWYGNGTAGSNAVFMFQNGSLTSMTQVGLK